MGRVAQLMKTARRIQRRAHQRLRYHDRLRWYRWWLQRPARYRLPPAGLLRGVVRALAVARPLFGVVAVGGRAEGLPRLFDAFEGVRFPADVPPLGCREPVGCREAVLSPADDRFPDLALADWRLLAEPDEAGPLRLADPLRLGWPEERPPLCWRAWASRLAGTIRFALTPRVPAIASQSTTVPAPRALRHSSNDIAIMIHIPGQSERGGSRHARHPPAS